MDAIGQLTGGIAHDFNNLLGIMLGNLELVALTIDTDNKAQEYIKSINKAGLRAANLTKQLLGFSRSEAALVTTTNINSSIESMMELIKRSLTPEVEVELQLSDELWLTEIDKGDLEDSLLNLSINARDAMSGRGHLIIKTCNIEIDAAYCEQNLTAKVGEYIKLTVEDSGKGISDKTIEHIFEPFFTTKDQGKGTGLGLAMVYGFVTRSGGFIECDSRLEVGTSFHLYLPRSTKENQFPEQSNGEARVIPKGQETILVVDDEPDLLKLAITLLERQGYHVLGASDGHAALKILDEEPAIVLLFSDIVMPNGINGYELAEQATQKRHELKVLLTSGYTEKVDLKDSQKIFTTNMLSKPYTQERLAKAIRSILDEQDS